jgi:hypothetical protein
MQVILRLSNTSRSVGPDDFVPGLKEVKNMKIIFKAVPDENKLFRFCCHLVFGYWQLFS